MRILNPAKTLLSNAAWTAYHIYRLGPHYRKRFQSVEKLMDGCRERINEWQWSRLTKRLEHAYQTTSYYRTLFDSLGIKPNDIRHPADLVRIPPLEKSTLHDRLKDLISTAIPKHHLMKNATGGSTGTPLVFYQDRAYWNQRNLSVYYFDRWAGWDFGERQLIIWGAQVDLTQAGRWKQRVNNYWRNHQWLDGFHLTEQEILSTFEKMRRWSPQTILAYASSLYLFAKYLHQNGRSPDWELKGIISSAEMLYPHYRELAEKVLGTKVYNRYGGREVGLITMECKAGRMHINAHDLYLEIDSPQPYSQPGEILITQLNNDAMPFIRYRIGDVGLLSNEVCPCGNRLPILGQLIGRTTATFRTRSGKLIHGGYFTQQFYGVKNVVQFQLIQASYERCRLKLVVSMGFTNDTLEWIIDKIKDALGREVAVDVEFVDAIPKPASGKMAFTISKVTSQLESS